MQTWKKIALVVGALSLVGATAAFAAGHHGGGGRFMQHMIASRIEAAEDYIDATPQQRKVIDAAKDDIVAKLQARMQAHQGQRQKWLALLTAPNLDAQALQAEADQHAEDIKAAAREIIPDLVKVHDALTPAQRQKLADHVAKMHGHRGPDADQ